MPPEIACPGKILVFLPPSAGAMIATRLAERSYEVVVASTALEVSALLRSGDFAFAVTTRQKIDLVRDIRPLPVINIEVFFHADPTDDGLLAGAKRFDGRAFMKRVEFLAQAAFRELSSAVPEPVKYEQRRMSQTPKWSRLIKFRSYFASLKGVSPGAV